MPVIKREETNDVSRPYSFYGLSLTKRGTEFVGDCPFCDKSNKFSVNSSNGKWRCLACTEGPEEGVSVKGGNPMTFLRTLYRVSGAVKSNLTSLMVDRGLMSTETLEDWGVVKSVTSGEWLIPSYNVEGNLCNLYRYAYLNGKRRVISGPKPDFNQQIFGLGQWGDSKEIVFIAEGPWDGMVIYEILKETKSTEGGLAASNSQKESLLDQINVISIPGCNSFNPAWAKLLAGKDVVLLFDNDHPRVNSKTNQTIPPAALEGLKRTTAILTGESVPPRTIRYLSWGEPGYTKTLPSGTDLRDLFGSLKTMRERISVLESKVLDRLKDVPDEWVSKDGGSIKNAKPTVGLKSCDSYKVLTNAWRKALKWTDGLDKALCAMLASISSVNLVGDQLWIKIIGPASCLDGDTPILDPVDGTTKSVRERTKEGRRFFVWTIKGNKEFGIAEALPPVKHQLTDIYEVEFKSGRKWKVTAGHEFWNGSSYVSVGFVFDELERVASYPVQTISEPVLSTHGQDVQHSMKILRDFRDYCYAYSCLDDELLLQEGDIDLKSVPSLNDVLEYTPVNLDRDGSSELLRRCIHRSTDPPSNLGVELPSEFSLYELQPKNEFLLSSVLSSSELTNYWFVVSSCIPTLIYQIDTTPQDDLFWIQSIYCELESRDQQEFYKRGLAQLSESGQFPAEFYRSGKDEYIDQFSSSTTLVFSQDEFQFRSVSSNVKQPPVRLLESYSNRLGSYHCDTNEPNDFVFESTSLPSQPSEIPLLKCKETSTLLTLTEVDEIVKIVRLKRDCYYDFHVPETNNYWALGGFHHNCGKSTLCEAVSTNAKYVLAKSTVRGFHSGFDPSDDCSLIAQVAGKTLVTKDGDTLLQSPNLPQILSEARDIYDTVSRTSYRNKASRDYTGVRMTWLLCGTSSLRSIDSSELGERFLDCVIMEGIDDDMEDEILVRVANRSVKNLCLEAEETSTYEPDMMEAMALTGGYISWLRENAAKEISKIEFSDYAKRCCIHFGKFVAYMRARPSTRQDETAEREFAARLVSQQIRLATTQALVLNKKEIDTEVLNRTRAIALDTARGKTTEIARHLYSAGPDGVEVKPLSMYVNQKESEVRHLLRFLKMIGVVDVFQKSHAKGVKGRPAWTLTPRMRNLWERVHQLEGESS